jgi:hypothetical protein
MRGVDEAGYFALSLIRPRHPLDAAARISIHENNYDFRD